MFRGDDEVHEFTIANFPLMNANDFVIMLYIFSRLDHKTIYFQNVYNFMYDHTRGFVQCYYEQIALTDFELAKDFNIIVKRSTNVLKDIRSYKDMKTFKNPKGIVLYGKKVKGTYKM